jgi:hypothetical protein
VVAAAHTCIYRMSVGFLDGSRPGSVGIA